MAAAPGEPLRPPEHDRRLRDGSRAGQVRRRPPEPWTPRADREVYGPLRARIGDQRPGEIDAQVLPARAWNGDDETNASADARVDRLPERNIASPHLARVDERRATQSQVLLEAGEHQPIFEPHDSAPPATRLGVFIPTKTGAFRA